LEFLSANYDALGRRVAKHVGAVATSFVWDGDRVVHEVTPDAVVGWEYDGLSPIARVQAGRCLGVLSDHLGAPSALVDTRGAVQWEATLDAWGRREGGDAALCPWRWPGQYEDAETGLYYNRFRYYDPADGRYISPDPAGMLGGSRPYAYVADPLTGFDSFGLAFEPRVLTEGIIYRQGSGSDMSLTPRPGKDDVLRPGDTHAGLSTSLQAPAAGEKAVALDVKKLREQGLMVLHDKPNGHVTIFPVDEAGKFDHARLQEWSSTRPKLETGGKADELTEKVKKCKA
jgi:RHS repeat-associated protein